VNFSNALIDPINRTGESGEDLFSGNYNWSLPIVGLTGRAGLDLGLSMTYNSLVWTRSGSSIGFDLDKGFPSAGFRLGFPTIQQPTYTSQSGAVALLLLMPSGRRVELRQVSATLFESADSSWLQLDTSVNPMILRTSDGAQLSFQLAGGDYKCTQIKDRNGNYITINYDTSGHISTVKDTLSRTMTFVYSNNNLQKITQQWNGTDHPWAQFEYSSLTIQTSFSGLSIVVGPQNGTTLTVLSKVTLDDSSYFTFDYTSYGQVKKISHNATDAHLLGSAAYDMNTAAGQTDCPRFTKRTDYAENWNNGSSVDTSFTFDRGTGSGSVTTPDGTLTKETHSVSGYNKGLTTQVDTYSSANLSTPKKTIAITWTQDSTSLSYPVNPRATETDITDDESNLKRTTISYSTLTLPSSTICSLPSDIREYASDGTTVLRKTHTDYVTTSAYLNQHIIGLPSARYLYDSDSQTATPLSKVTFAYDASAPSNDGEPVQHDSSYGTGFTTRGNSTSVTRWDVTTLGNQTPQSVTSTMSYNTAGDLISTSDPLSHQVTISYTDLFGATGTTLPSSTLAYPTTVTDADSKSSTVQYDYDLGVAKVTTDPKGATLTKTFDGAGRVTKIESNLVDGNNNHAYTRIVYQQSMTEVDTYVLQSTAPTVEIYSAQFLDGAGRVISTRRELLGSTGGYSGQKFVYDVMGRVSQQSNPTEIDVNGTPKGDDQTAGWLYTTQTYDWKGRPLVTTNTDTTNRTVTYGGCGCAGGVVTTQDEVLRKQKMTYDVVGRLLKTEVLNADLTTYSTTKNTYNGRDQVTLIRQYQGSDTSTTYQDTVMSYDGHGRLSMRKAPAEDSATTYAYYSDDTVQTVTDPRGASSTFTYNGRHLVTGITYAKPGNSPLPDTVSAVPAVTFDYDDAGNRLLMTDGLGRVDYVHDMWSRLTSETRTFNDFPNSTYPLNYAYNLAGELKQLTDAFQFCDELRVQSGRSAHIGYGIRPKQCAVLHKPDPLSRLGCSQTNRLW
jgi:YD repeat-containing protein